MIPRVLALYGTEGGCNLWRVFRPFMELQARGYTADGCPLDDAPDMFQLVAEGRYDAVILPRLTWEREHQHVSRGWIETLHAAGLTVIYEIDDDAFTPQIIERQQYTVAPHMTAERLEQERRSRIAAMRLCDGVTVASEPLEGVVRQYLRPETMVRVVPNQIDVRWWRGMLRGVQRVVPQLTIGWCGGARYPNDLAPLAEAWHTIAERYPEVHFVIQGFPSELLIDAVPRERLHLFKWRPVEEYMLDIANVDIGCAIVAENHFNSCKTPIKVWEYTLAGAVTVCTPTLYGPVTTPEVDTLHAVTAAEWTAQLARLVEDPSLRFRLWKAQRRRISERYNLQRNWGRWVEAWSDIIEAHRSRTWWNSVLRGAA